MTLRKGIPYQSTEYKNVSFEDQCIQLVTDTKNTSFKQRLNVEKHTNNEEYVYEYTYCNALV